MDFFETRIAEIETEKTQALSALEDSENTEKICTELVEKHKAKLEELHVIEERENDAVSVKEIEYEKSHQKQEFYQQNVDRVNEDIETEEKALAEIIESMNENARLLEQNKKDIEEIRLTIEASLDVQSDATKELEEKKEINSENTSSNKIICPNCGKEQIKNQFGCIYCHSKFE